jgi:hypothetical protein
LIIAPYYVCFILPYYVSICFLSSPGPHGHEHTHGHSIVSSVEQSVTLSFASIQCTSTDANLFSVLAQVHTDPADRVVWRCTLLHALHSVAGLCGDARSCMPFTLLQGCVEMHAFTCPSLCCRVVWRCTLLHAENRRENKVINCHCQC